MNTKLIAILVAGVVVVGGGVYFASQMKTKNSASASNDSSTTKTAAPSSTFKKACDLFTLTDAQQVLGPNAKAGSALGNSESSSPDASAGTCTYNNTDTSTTATVLVRTALTSDGKTNNQAGYAQDKKMYKGSDVSGVGEAAYYDTDLGQLEFLKGNDWIIVTSGGFGAANHSQAQSTQIAQLMLQKL